MTISKYEVGRMNKVISKEKETNRKLYTEKILTAKLDSLYKETERENEFLKTLDNLNRVINKSFEIFNTVIKKDYSLSYFLIFDATDRYDLGGRYSCTFGINFAAPRFMLFTSLATLILLTYFVFLIIKRGQDTKTNKIFANIKQQQKHVSSPSI